MIFLYSVFLAMEYPLVFIEFEKNIFYVDKEESTKDMKEQKLEAIEDEVKRQKTKLKELINKKQEILDEENVESESEEESSDEPPA